MRLEGLFGTSALLIPSETWCMGWFASLSPGITRKHVASYMYFIPLGCWTLVGMLIPLSSSSCYAGDCFSWVFVDCFSRQEDFISSLENLLLMLVTYLLFNFVLFPPSFWLIYIYINWSIIVKAQFNLLTYINNI